jgi:hypothetical protein
MNYLYISTLKQLLLTKYITLKGGIKVESENKTIIVFDRIFVINALLYCPPFSYKIILCKPDVFRVYLCVYNPIPEPLLFLFRYKARA